MASVSLEPILSSTKISLEKAASDKFGAAVESFAQNSIGNSLGIAVTPGTIPAPNRGDGSFYASSFAAALAAGTDYRPKQKFIFKVEFIFSDEAKKAVPKVFGDAKTNNDFTFMVKSVDRPKIDFDYDEVNMYNFNTKVLKKVHHRELTITFMDDIGNRVLNFFRGLMTIYQPITRRQYDREVGADGKPLPMSARLAPPNPYSDVKGNGMAFTAPTVADHDDTSHRGILLPGADSTNITGSVIQTIRVKQIYTDPGEKLGSAVKEVIFDFVNARLVSFDLDDLAHDSSDVNIMTMQFDYDWMEIVEVGSLQATDTPIYNVKSVGGAPTDYSPNVGGATSDSGGLLSQFTGILTGSASRAVQQLSATAVSNAITKIAGKGQFASLINSQVSNIVGSTLGGATRSLATTVSQSNAIPSLLGNVIRSPAQASNTVVSASTIIDSDRSAPYIDPTSGTVNNAGDA